MFSYRKWIKAPLLWSLRSRKLREVITYETRREYSDLILSIPLEADLFCPVFKQEHIWSFTEIFLHQEYHPFLKACPLPGRWLDLGAHAGFFSLLMAWEHRKVNRTDYSGLLVDADQEAVEACRKMIRHNSLEERLQVEWGAIASGKQGEVYQVAEGMKSFITEAPVRNGAARVPVLGPQQLRKLFPPPYDLIKIDIEGAESSFLAGYQEVYREARYLLLEWHSGEPGNEEVGIQEQVGTVGFRLKEIIQPKRVQRFEEEVLVTGVHLYERA